jgi:prepilin-type N-terminal cleavage/methylation domain-containing protein
MRRSRGFALIELLVCIAIILLLSAMTYSVFITTNKSKALDTDALKVAEKLRQARSLTISAKNDTVWGIHFATSSVTLFQGSSYSSSDSNNVFVPLNPYVTVSTTSLNGGGSEVIFQRLTGETTQYGTSTLALIASSTQTHQIVIYKTGIVEIQ